MEDELFPPSRPRINTTNYDYPTGVTDPASPVQPQERRKWTLLQILDALADFEQTGLTTGSDPSGPKDKPSAAEDRKNKIESVEDDRDQVEGAAIFDKFQGQIKALDKELQNFANAARQLGSSVGLLSSAFHLRQRLTHILYIFRENAAELFPKRVQKAARETVRPFSRKGMAVQRRVPINVTRPAAEHLTVESLPAELESLAKELTAFLHCLNEFPEFTDEGVNATMVSFDGDLRYWAETLQDFRGQFKFKGVLLYVHDLSTEMAMHLDSITNALKVFVEVGVPTIRFAQKQASNNLLNLSTISAFFSGVTATAIQYSFDKLETDIDVACNLFFFVSLVLSIAATVNSLLGLTWKHAMYRSPRHRVPWWVNIWIKRSPLIFLIISVASFSAALVLFTYATQPQLIAIFTLVLTCFSSFGLLAVSSWFAAERWTFSKHKGRRWFGDILADMQSRFLRATGLHWCLTVPPTQVREKATTVRRHVQRAATWGGSSISRVMTTAGLTSAVSVNNNSPTTDDRGSLDEESTVGAMSPPPSPEVRTTHLRRPSDAPSARSLPTSPTTPLSSPALNATGPLSAGATDSPESPSSPGKSAARSRFAQIGWKVARLRTAASGPAHPFNTSLGPPRQAPRAGTLLTDQGTPRPRRDTLNEPTMMRRARYAALIPPLKALKQQDRVLDDHTALVRHLQFSPDGKWLATGSWDRTCRIYSVPQLSGDQFEAKHVLQHQAGFVGQVAWSPDSSMLLVKYSRGLKLWSVSDGVCLRTIDRARLVTSITWLPSGQGFLSVEGSRVYSMNLQGKVLETYHLERMDLQDVVVTPDEKRLFAVANLTHSHTGRRPVKSRPEKRILAYNIAEKQIETQLPVINDVRDITLSQNGRLALISYENKAPPQLWRIDIVNDDPRLVPLKTYIPAKDVDFAGTSYLAGPKSGVGDELVLVPAKTGEVLIWDREYGTLLHSIKAQDGNGDLTGIAWNNSSETFMLASASSEGVVTIWTSPHVVNMAGLNEAVALLDGYPGSEPEPLSAPSFFMPRRDRSGSSQGMLRPGHHLFYGMETSSPNETELEIHEQARPSREAMVESPTRAEFNTDAEASSPATIKGPAPTPPATEPPAEKKRSVFFARPKKIGSTSARSFLDKSDKSDKSDKTDKADKSDKADKADKTDKTDKTDAK